MRFVKSDASRSSFWARRCIDFHRLWRIEVVFGISAVFGAIKWAEMRDCGNNILIIFVGRGGENYLLERGAGHLFLVEKAIG